MMLPRLFLVALLASPPLLRHSARPAAPPSAVLGKSNKLGKTIEQRIEKQIQVDFDEAPLREALNKLAKNHGIRIAFDEQGIQEDGISLDNPITLSLQKASLRYVLDRMLYDFRLVAIVKENVLKVMPKPYDYEAPVTATYPISDLLRSMKQEALIKQIRDTIVRCSWQANGGKGTIIFCPQTAELMVYQHPDVQEQIGDLLNALKALQALQ
jgi:type II secretory pathway component GspD/PulD (secretin)